MMPKLANLILANLLDAYRPLIIGIDLILFGSSKLVLLYLSLIHI